ncbi:MAG: hypothetical protein ACKV0T_07955 [Planctomycetales bacterium]
MPRFILIDPPLVSTVGHHHEFAHNVLTAAAGLGWEGVLAGHQQCRVAACGGWPVRPLYRDGLWTHQAGSRGLRLLSYATSALQRGGKWTRPCQTLTRQGRDAWRARRFAADTQRLLAELEVRPDDLVFLPNATLTEVWGITRLLRESRLAQQASWHMEFHFNVFPAGVPHHPGAWPAAREMQQALRVLRVAADATPLFLYTDTEELTEQYEALRAGPFFTLPIPVDPVFHRASPDRLLAPAPSQAALVFSYVGDARIEKGYPQLPEMIQRVWREQVATNRVRFVIQSNCRPARSERAAFEARDELAALDSPAVQLLTEPLSTADYRQLVLNSDALLLPYDPGEYEARSSGILSEALGAGIPVAVPDGSWMARQLRDAVLRHRLELQSLGVWPADGDRQPSLAIAGPVDSVPRSSIGVVYPAGPEGLAQAVEELATHFRHYRNSAANFAAAWVRRHHPRILVEQLCRHADQSLNRIKVQTPPVQPVRLRA